jgi:hypothetical protein
MGKSEFLPSGCAGARGASRPKVVKGLDAVIEIASLGIALPLTEIYAGFE